MLMVGNTTANNAISNDADFTDNGWTSLLANDDEFMHDLLNSIALDHTSKQS